MNRGWWIAGYVAAAVALAGASTLVLSAGGSHGFEMGRVSMVGPGVDEGGLTMPGHGPGSGWSFGPGEGQWMGPGMMPMPGSGMGPGMMPGHGWDERMCEYVPDEMQQRCLDAIGQGGDNGGGS